MAIPYYVNASTGSTDATGAWTHTGMAPGAAGRIIILQVLQDGTAANVTVTSVTNIEQLDGTDGNMTSIGEFDVGSAVAASQHLWIGRSLSTSAPVVTGANAGGDDVYVRMYEFDNCSTGTTLAEVIENSSAGGTANSAGTSGTASDAAVTTLGPDRLALNFVAANDDVTIALFSSAGLQSWAQPVTPYVDSGGTDGAIALQAAWPGTICGGLGSSSNQFGNTTTRALAQQLTTSGALAVEHVTVALQKTGTPVDDLVVEFQTDSGGLPSGTPVGSSATLAGTDITTTIVPYRIAVSASLSASTIYHLVVRRSGAADGSNFYGLRRSSTDSLTAAGWIFESQAESTGVWTDQAGDVSFALQTATDVSTGVTIDGGAGTLSLSAAWGSCGFALIGTTAAGPTEFFHDPLRVLQAVNRGSVW